MTSAIEVEGVVAKRRSVSQLSSFMQCGESYRLQRVAKAPQRPAAWFAQGSSVHEVLEEWEKWGRIGTVDQATDLYRTVYDRMIQEQLEQSEVPAEGWLTGSKKPGNQDIDERRERGAEHVVRYIEWAQATSDKWQVWAPDGAPKVEVEFDTTLGGVQIKGFIDQIILDLTTGLVYSRDIKTGTKRPDTPFQLAVYALAMEDMFDILPVHGSFAMTKEAGDKIEHFEPLHNWDRDIVAQMFRDFDQAEREGLYIPQPGSHCRTCPVAEFCRIQGEPEKSGLYLAGVRPTEAMA